MGGSADPVGAGEPAPRRHGRRFLASGKRRSSSPPARGGRPPPLSAPVGNISRVGLTFQCFFLFLSQASRVWALIAVWFHVADSTAVSHFTSILQCSPKKLQCVVVGRVCSRKSSKENVGSRRHRRATNGRPPHRSNALTFYPAAVGCQEPRPGQRTSYACTDRQLHGIVRYKHHDPFCISLALCQLECTCSLPA